MKKFDDLKIPVEDPLANKVKPNKETKPCTCKEVEINAISPNFLGTQHRKKGHQHKKKLIMKLFKYFCQVLNL